MNSKFSTLKSIALTAALVACISGAARADDSSMNPFTGDSYADFDVGNLPKSGNPVYDKSTSEWRQNNPDGLSDRQLQSLATFAPMVYKPAPVFDYAPSVWRHSHPNGLSEGELQALSSEASGWHPSEMSATTALASTTATDVTSASPDSFFARIAKFFHATPADQAAPAN